METTYRLLQGTLPFPLMVQGEAPRTQLLDRFRQDVSSVLLATRSFWQGVDVVGEALSCLIIHKLPFGFPGYPSWRLDWNTFSSKAASPSGSTRCPPPSSRCGKGWGG